jgi:hypothetical protein
MSTLLLSRTAADKNSKCAIACVMEKFLLVSNFYILQITNHVQRSMIS